MRLIDYHDYYWAGIAVVSSKFGIRMERLSTGDECGLDGGAKLEPLESWCKSDAGISPSRSARVEDYCTTLLAGSAASYIYVEDRRCHLKKTFGNAGIEMKFLRDVYECLQREPDRALAIIVGSLGEFDDGDATATTRRLWHRAVRILRQPKLYDQLTRLARRLEVAREMTGDEIRRVLENR